MSALPNTNKPVVFMPFELIDTIQDIKVGERNGIDGKSKDYYFPITYQDQRVRIQTPELFVLFGLTTYKPPGDKTTKYSVHVSIKETNQEIKTFVQMLKLMDEFACEYKMDDRCEYNSAMREDYDKQNQRSPLARLKIATSTNQNKLLIDLIDKNGKIYTLPTADIFNNLVKHRTKVRCIIEVNPIWYSNKKYGLSYRVLKLQIMKNNDDEAYNLQFR